MTTEMPMEPKPDRGITPLNGVIAVGGLAVVSLAFAVFVVGPSPDDSAAHISACETAVGSQLRAPSGARYYSIDMAEAKYGTVQGSVDAENGFGGHNAYSFMCADSTSGAKVIYLTQETGLTPSY